MSSEKQNGETMENEGKTILEAKEEVMGTDEIEEATKDEKDEVKKEEDAEEDEEEESSDEEELPLGSVEAPVQIMTGKRERKKTERLVMTEPPKTPEKKFEVPEGKGMKLAELIMVAHQLDKTRAQDLKPLHKFLFGKMVKDLRETKKNIRLFSGFNFEKEDTEYAKRESVLCKFTMEGIKELCTVLDVEKKGTKDQVMDRLMDFCLNPQPSGRTPPEKGQKKGKGKTQKKKKPKAKKTEGSAKKKRKTKAGGDASTASEDGDTTMEDATEGDTSITGSDSDAKKAKKSTPKLKKPKTPKSAAKPGAKSPAKSPKKKKIAVKTPQKQTKKASPVKSAKKSPKKRKQDDLIDDDDSSDDEPLVKKTKSPPSDSEIRKTIKGILEGANLEEVTMKMVCRKVYETFPDFPLQHKKDFIKSTVREIIS